MSKYLIVGDPHAQVTNLEDSNRLFHFIQETAKKYNVDRIVILGDLHHTHDLKRVLVEDLISRSLDMLSQEFQTIVLVGNHDLSNQKDPNSPNALSQYKDSNNENLLICETPNSLGDVMFVPYIHDQDTFIKICNEQFSGPVPNTIFCHQTFKGIMYGPVPAPDSFDQSKLKANLVISGHIHDQIELGKVWYPGSPKWETISDSGKDKGIWVCDIDESKGEILSKEFVSTKDVVTPIISVVWNEGEDRPVLPERGVLTIELVGSRTFINKNKELFRGKARIKTTATDSVIRENRKPMKSIVDFLDNSYKVSSDKDKLKSYLIEKGF